MSPMTFPTEVPSLPSVVQHDDQELRPPHRVAIGVANAPWNRQPSKCGRRPLSPLVRWKRPRPALSTTIATQFMKDQYPTGKADLMTAFMLNAQVLTKPGGTWGMINLPSWMSLKSFEDLRHDLLWNQRLVSMIHLGRGVFGSDFGSVAFVVVNAEGNGGRAVYRRLFEQHVDVRSVATIEALFLDCDYNRFEVAQSDFAAIPGSPIVYWLSEKMRATFGLGKQLGEVAEPRQGLATADNNRFLRQWWEVSAERTGLSCGSRAM